MYFYITERLKEGYKVGITNDINKRQQQYTTLIPNIGFHLYVKTWSAEEIEKSFKHKFGEFRVINRTSSKEMKSEVYEVKIYYLMLHFINCIHFCKQSVILCNDEGHFAENEFIKGKINLYLSNIYLPFKNKKAKFLHFGILSNQSVWLKIKIGEIEVSSAEFKDKKVIKHNGLLTLKNFTKDQLEKAINLRSEYIGNISQSDFDKKLEDLKVEKIVEKINGNYIINYLSPWEIGHSKTSSFWFKKLQDFKMIRNFDNKKLIEKGGWTTKRLRFFGLPYPYTLDKLHLDRMINNDKLI